MLFEPIKINRVTLKNRIVIPAITMGFSADGQVTDRLIQLYQQRAQGGAGLIMIGGVAVQASGVYGGFLSIHNDDYIAGHEELTRHIHDAGSRAGIQLFHSGGYSSGFLTGQEVIAPSAVPSGLTGHTPREMTVEDIEQCIADFGEAAIRGKKAGYDLVEVINSAGYLINQFLSPQTNKRTDQYGGSFANRMRFGLEVIRNIRFRLGPDFAIAVRLGGSDFVTGGNTWKEMGLYARELEQSGVDLFNVTGGWHESKIPQIQSDVPRGAYAYLAAKIKAQVQVPVVASNRINDPVIAQEILENSQADLVSVARGFLADAEWGIKARGKGNIRRCIACMACLSRLFQNQPLLCAINPQCGYEEERVLEKTDYPRKLLIIGAGPAGLEAARVAALRGHKVTVWEKEAFIGGQWNLAAIPPGKGEFASLLDYYQVELARLKVNLCLNHSADIQKTAAENPDAIIVATGAIPVSPDFSYSPDMEIVDAWDVLQGHKLRGPRITIIGGGSTGTETALFLAEKGAIDMETLRFLVLHQVEDLDTIQDLLTRGTYQVNIVEMKKSLAQDMSKAVRWLALKQIRSMGITPYLGFQVRSITGDSVVVVKDGLEEIIPSDTVVMALGSQANDRLYRELKSLVPEVYLIGDAAGPGRVLEAIHQAFEIASRI